jgi:hypothetical protein
MLSSRLTLAAVVLGLSLLALVLGQNSNSAETFSFDQWDRERNAKAPLLERAKVAGETETSGAH